MAKLPYMQFYPSDYQADVRCLPMDAQGAWMQILCILWRTPRGKRTLNLEEWAREIGCLPSDLSLYIKVLEHHKVGKISRELIANVEQITIISKRILREKMKQKLALDRKRKQRDMQMSRACPMNVTPKNQNQNQNQNQISESELREEKKEKKKIKSCDEGKPVAVPKSAETWDAYSRAYLARYKVMPVRNQTTNAQLCKLVDKLGFEAAPHVAAYYLTHHGSWYVQKMHPVNLLLVDAEKLHTEWLTGRQVTKAQADQIDKTAGRLNVFQELINERKQQGEVIHVKVT